MNAFIGITCIFPCVTDRAVVQPMPQPLPAHTDSELSDQAAIVCHFNVLSCII